MNKVARKDGKEKREQVNFADKVCWVEVDVHKVGYAVAVPNEEGQQLEFPMVAEPKKLLVRLVCRSSNMI